MTNPAPPSNDGLVNMLHHNMVTQIGFTAAEVLLKNGETVYITWTLHKGKTQIQAGFINEQRQQFFFSKT